MIRLPAVTCTDWTYQHPVMETGEAGEASFLPEDEQAVESKSGEGPHEGLFLPENLWASWCCWRKERNFLQCWTHGTPHPYPCKKIIGSLKKKNHSKDDMRAKGRAETSWKEGRSQQEGDEGE